ncbi:unnamed protein product [Clavelina lepadiformis]|uniref:Uncharacterized protein n=1 Tax=Clavelina lepadiformis TaxID=159417 RepID=A0ABP0G5K9_CLALP
MTGNRNAEVKKLQKYKHVAVQLGELSYGSDVLVCRSGKCGKGGLQQVAAVPHFISKCTPVDVLSPARTRCVRRNAIE